MFNRNKKSFFVTLSLCFLATMGSIGFVNAETFAERLSDIGLDVNTFSNKNSISRYEVTRLLNAANCYDCVQASDWMRQTYTQEFWDKFRSIDGKDFDDIDYGAGVWNKKSYYYCVAYIGDNGYMAGYPSTSTKCKGKFCGQEDITTSEFYQTVLNIIQDQIRQKYLINWADVKAWKKGLKKDSIQMRVLNQTNLDVINNADSNTRSAQSNDEFQTWLKYCMYNLSACNFQPFGVIGTGYWPVSELNILYKEGVITLDDAKNVASFPSMKGNEAIRIFSAVYDNYTNCSFNVDYDCDGITNGKDNCPYMYNVNQYDIDGDGIGNVCDDDIDGDGQKNPIGIVDDNDHVVVSIWDNKLDQTPLGNGGLGFSFFINVDAMSTGFPTNVRFSPLTNGNISKIEWDFGDGTKEVVNNGNKINHLFHDSGSFTVKAIATSVDGHRSFAMSKVFIATSKSDNYVLYLRPSAVIKNGGIEYTFTPMYSGNISKVEWTVNDNDKVSQKVDNVFKFMAKEKGKYVITARGYDKYSELRAIAMFTVMYDGGPIFSSMNIKVGKLWEETTVTSNLVGILKTDVDYISIDWGKEQTWSTDLSQSYSYDEAGLQTLQYSIVLNDGTVLYNVATITIQNPQLLQSYAVNISGNRLSYNQNEKLALGLAIYPKSPVLSLFTSYQLGSKNFLISPDLSNVLLDFTYSLAGDKLLTNSVQVNRCVSLINQGTISINSVDVCERLLKNGSLNRYKCDMDGDGIPDICDDDIDGDGMKNFVGIITKENKDCSIGIENIDSELLKKQLGVCSLDNCPFSPNENQLDLNNNGIGEICEATISSLLSSSMSSNEGSITLTLDRDQDGDGIPDSMDECIDVPGNSANGCPEYYSQKCWIYSKCGNGVVDEGENCNNCPEDVGVCCGNGVLDKGENCNTCLVDAGECGSCGNGKIDEGESCENCPEDVGECNAYCGNGKIEDAEDCRNCPEDVGVCSATCGNDLIEKGEDCENCIKDVKECVKKKCGNGEIDKGAGEECDNGNENGIDGECTKMCTIYDVNKPKCGNGEIDEGEICQTCAVDLGEKCVKNGDKEKQKTCGNEKIDEGENCNNCPEDVGECNAYCGNGKIEDAEDCRNCPEDVGICSKTCGNGKIDEGEDCKNCSEDVGECTAYCGNGKIEDAEDCRNCPKDVGECSTTCGNGKFEMGEDCKNCVEDVKECKKDLCGNGVIDKGAGEECDNGKENGKDGKCTKECTVYDANKPKCGNGEIDEGEICQTCAVDLGEKCVKDGNKEKQKTCGNGEIDELEDCKNCPEDVGECTAYCGNGKIEDAEDCRNCPEDVGVCSATCGNGEIEKGEDCEDCMKDVKECKKDLCGNEKIDEGAGEECDNGKENGKDGKCTKECTVYDANKPKCGNGEINEGEICQTCAVDLGEKCVKDGDKGKSGMCGNGQLDEGEICDPKDETKNNWGAFGCSNFCKQINDGSAVCNPEYDGMRLNLLLNSDNLCQNGLMKKFSFNISRMRWSWLCFDEKTQNSVECSAEKSSCGDLVLGKDEKCKNCSEDLKDRCVTKGDKSGGDCKCEECSEDLKDICVTKGNPPEGDCKCEECPEHLKDRCVTNGDQPEGDCKCEECPENLKDKCVTNGNNDDNGNNDNQEPEIDNPEQPSRDIQSDDCNSCPCEYADFSSDLIKGDTVRAKLWDKALSVFYKYSNSVALENFIDF